MLRQKALPQCFLKYPLGYFIMGLAHKQNTQILQRLRQEVLGGRRERRGWRGSGGGECWDFVVFSRRRDHHLILFLILRNSENLSTSAAYL